MAVCAGATSASVNGCPRFSRVTFTSWPALGGSDIRPSIATLPTNQLFLVMIRTVTPLRGGLAIHLDVIECAGGIKAFDGRVHICEPQRRAYLKGNGFSQFRGGQRLLRRHELNIGNKLPFVPRRLRPSHLRAGQQQRG